MYCIWYRNIASGIFPYTRHSVTGKGQSRIGTAAVSGEYVFGDFITDRQAACALSAALAEV